MITAIPNQPVNLSGSLMEGCACDPVVPPTLFNPASDTLGFQFLMPPCPGTPNLIADYDFRGDDWVGGGVVVGNGRACVYSVAGATIENTDFSPTPGTPYIFTFTVSGLVGALNWSFGGSSGQVGAPFTGSIEARPQTFTFYVMASGTGGVFFQFPTDRDGACIRFVSVQEQSRDITVDIIQDGSAFESFTSDADPDAFTFAGNHVIFESELDEELSGCFTVRVTEVCNEQETVLESQQFITTSNDCTLKLRVCGGGYDMLGLLRPVLEMRLDAKLVHAAWDATVSEERRSNGRWVRSYGDSSRRMELRIGLQSEYAHPFLSLLPILPSFLIGQDEYMAAGDAWEPGYGDVFDGTAPMVLTVYPKQELRRVVICGDEPLPCPPPPNYLVQGTGPNDDLVLTQQGEAILLNS